MARVRMSEQWNAVVEDFERNNPDLVDQVVDWYPVGQMEIAVKLRNGKRLIYNFIGNYIQTCHDPREVDESIEEIMWREEFAKRLCKKMKINCVSQETLSDLTGISKVTLSKYMNGLATPSSYNTDRLAKALKCSSSEFMNIRR